MAKWIPTTDHFSTLARPLTAFPNALRAIHKLSKRSADPRLWGPRFFMCKSHKTQGWVPAIEFGRGSWEGPPSMIRRAMLRGV